MKNMREEKFYEPVRKEMKRLFQEKYVKCNFEITAKGKFSKELRRNFNDIVFFFLKDKVYPDLTGFLIDPRGKNQIVIVEIKKRKLKIKDFYQSKMYAEIFKAAHCFLISKHPLSEELRRVLESMNWMIVYTRSTTMFPNDPKEYHIPTTVFVGLFDVKKNQIVEWFPSDPFLKMH